MVRDNIISLKEKSKRDVKIMKRTSWDMEMIIFY